MTRIMAKGAYVMEKTARGEKLYTRVFREIRAYIIRNKLQPGDQLPTEQTLCDMLGVSRNVLREAIKSMELMGMVSALPGRGTVLKPFNLDFIFQNVIIASVSEEYETIFEMLSIRKKLELGYMREAFQTLDASDVRGIRLILELIKERWRRREFFHADDRDFHMALFSKAGNSTLLSLMDAIWSVDENFRTEEKMKYLDDSVTKHENIVRALEAGNQEAFEAAMMAHFASGKYFRAGNFEEY